MIRMPIAALLFVALLATPAGAAQCGGDFSGCIASTSREAAAAGVSQNIISNAFIGVTQDQAVLAFDRRQRGTFRKTFEEYVSTRVGAGRIKRGTQLLQRHAALLARIERQYGVPPQVLVAIWGLESDFGSGDMGKLPVIRVLATMAHDCPCNVTASSCGAASPVSPSPSAFIQGRPHWLRISGLVGSLMSSVQITRLFPPGALFGRNAG